MHMVTDKDEQAWCVPNFFFFLKKDGAVCFGNWKTKHMKIKKQGS